MSDSKCNLLGMCDLLLARCVDSGKGFKALHTINLMDASVVSKFFGVAYRISNKDKGLMLNACPFCRGEPGYFERKDKS